MMLSFSKNFEEVINNLKEVFSRLQNANLKINPKKCAFLKREVKYLGHVIYLQRGLQQIQRRFLL